jgi:hypothetical protein
MSKHHDYDIRLAALHAAVELNHDTGADAYEVAYDAEVFAAFLHDEIVYEEYDDEE